MRMEIMGAARKVCRGKLSPRSWSKLFAAGFGSIFPGFVYASTNSGLNWSLTSAPTNNAWAAIAASADGSRLVAASGVAAVPGLTYGGIYTSTNFGATWFSNSVPNAQWSAVASSADGTKLIAVAAAPVGWIYTSTNAGATWISNNVPNNSWFAVASSADGGQLVSAPNSASSSIYISQSIQAPQLNLAASASSLTVAWTMPSTNFVLQQNYNLSTTNWSAVANAPVLNLTNLQNQVTLPLSARNNFFRLSTP